MYPNILYIDYNDLYGVKNFEFPDICLPLYLFKCFFLNEYYNKIPTKYHQYSPAYGTLAYITATVLLVIL